MKIDLVAASARDPDFIAQKVPGKAEQAAEKGRGSGEMTRNACLRG
jgi:hypothetical protein